MRIANLVVGLAPGGINTYFWDVAGMDGFRGVRVVNLVVTGPRWKIVGEGPPGLGYREVRTGGLADPSLWVKFARALDEASCDIAFAHSENTYTLLLAARLLARRRFRFVASSHGLFHAVGLGQRLRKIVYEPIVHPMVLARADRIVTPSSFHARQWAGRGAGGRKVVAIPNSIGERWFLPASPRAVNETFTFCCVARLVPVKGVDRAVEAMDRLRGRGVSCRLVIVGDGPMADSLRARVAALGLGGLVELAGARTDPLPVYRTSDAFVLPSLMENFPIVLLEAMSQGLPLVASDVGGVPEIVEEGRNGLLVPPGDGASLAAAMERVAGDAGLRARMAKANLERAKLYRREEMYSRLASVFEQVLAEAVEAEGGEAAARSE